jgi:signal transduction histidine kinase
METEAIVDSERKRLSREVHDQIGQIFTGLKMIARTLKPGSMAEDQHQAMMGAIESGVKISRRIAAELRPPLLDDFGIRAALEHYLKTTFEPLEIAFELQFPDKSRLHAQQKNQLFRMVQEACTNIIRHAQARQVDVVGHSSVEGLEVRIEDDGIGFNQTLVRVDALGLTGIEERARLCGATFSVRAREGGGTCVAILFPANVLEPEIPR